MKNKVIYIAGDNVIISVKEYVALKDLQIKYNDLEEECKRTEKVNKSEEACKRNAEKRKSSTKKWVGDNREWRKEYQREYRKKKKLSNSR